MTHVYYTVNSGLYFSCNGTGIFIDGIHGGADVGFSPVHPETVRQCAGRIGIFADLKALLFTHCHSDHFDPEAVSRLIVPAGASAGASSPTPPSVPSLFLCTPESPVPRTHPGITVEKAGPSGNGSLRFGIGSFDIYAVKTRHDGGKPLCFTPHLSFVINTPEETFLTAGDAVFTEDAAAVIPGLCRHPVKAAFVNPYQLLLESDREFLKNLSPECNVLIHLPKPEDDKYTVKILYDNAVKKYPVQMPKLLLPGFYSQIF